MIIFCKPTKNSGKQPKKLKNMILAKVLYYEYIPTNNVGFI